jgi:hypothetical protein
MKWLSESLSQVTEQPGLEVTIYIHILTRLGLRGAILSRIPYVGVASYSLECEFLAPRGNECKSSRNIAPCGLVGNP